MTLLFPKPTKKKKKGYKKDPKMEAWHKAVCERENYICQGCGKDYSDIYYFDKNRRNKYVFGHHEKTKASHPELKYTVSNGKCTDFKCHELCHRARLEYSENNSI
jgi:hypothetical protein